jgi:hypothetical protein
MPARALLAVLLLSGCVTTSPGGPRSLAERSAAASGCARVQISDHRRGDPAGNLAERWRAQGCGRRFECESFLLATGEPAETRCRESAGALDSRLRRRSAERAVRLAGCPTGQVKVEGAITEGDTRIYLVTACGRALRCVISRVGSAQEATRCTELAEGKR